MVANGWVLTSTLLASLALCARAKTDHFVVNSRHVCTRQGCWPLTWLLSCQKCGSTSLATTLKNEGLSCWANVTGINVGKPAHYGKETHFFDNATTGDFRPIRDYLELYPEKWSIACPSFLEATPRYLSTLGLPPFVAQTMPKSARDMMKFVSVLREPIARELSAYNHQRAINHDFGARFCPVSAYDTFESFVECELDIWNLCVEDHSRPIEQLEWEKIGRKLSYNGIFIGIYVLHLQYWVKYFPRDQFLILKFEDLLGQTERFLKTIKMHLTDVVPGADAEHYLVAVNKKDTGIKQATMSCRIVDRLQKEVFNKYNAMLYDMMEDDHRLGRAPLIEPAFGIFETPGCV